MGLYEERVKRLHDHVVGNQKKAEKLAEPSNKELMAILDEKGIEYDKKATKAVLLELIAKSNDGVEA